MDVIQKMVTQKTVEVLWNQFDISENGSFRRTAMLAFLLMLRLCAAPPAAEATYLYRATLLQAAPGKLLEVLDLYKSGWPGTRDSGDEPPLGMRHSQGDRWDLLLLFP